jgi:hypothetical protein
MCQSMLVSNKQWKAVCHQHPKALQQSAQILRQGRFPECCGQQTSRPMLSVHWRKLGNCLSLARLANNHGFFIRKIRPSCYRSMKMHGRRKKSRVFG